MKLIQSEAEYVSSRNEKFWTIKFRAGSSDGTISGGNVICSDVNFVANEGRQTKIRYNLE